MSVGKKVTAVSQLEYGIAETVIRDIEPSVAIIMFGHKENMSSQLDLIWRTESLLKLFDILCLDDIF